MSVVGHENPEEWCAAAVQPEAMYVIILDGHTCSSTEVFQALTLVTGKLSVLSKAVMCSQQCLQDVRGWFTINTHHAVRCLEDHSPYMVRYMYGACSHNEHRCPTAVSQACNQVNVLEGFISCSSVSCWSTESAASHSSGHSDEFWCIICLLVVHLMLLLGRCTHARCTHVTKATDRGLITVTDNNY
jgi:hypothetical protein